MTPNYTPHVGQPYDVTPRTDVACLRAQLAAVTAERDAEQSARKELVAALLICIRYADTSADTEQAHAALALAAKLP